MAQAQARAFTIHAVGYEEGLPDLRSVREAVFVQEQGVPLALEWDELDPVCHHVVARDGAGDAIGTGRLTPARGIGRMAVLPEWRGRGVGDALLQALLEQSRTLGWPEVTLHAQAAAVGFYARAGFLPVGGRFQEAGIEHQGMRLLPGALNPVDSRDAAIAATSGVIAGARRHLDIYSRELDPGLLDQPEIVAAIRRCATGGECAIRILLQEPAAPRRAFAPLIALGQRLPSAIAFRAVEEQVDRSYASAFIANDGGGHFFRPLGQRWEGETRLDGAGRARHLRGVFDPFWERARPCTEYRALGI
ncbi:GNAT family N-acetyltransferase [Luteimonas changyuni]|uniref:GNAT family N-acetyltransferase n=1 Tax=Luteimonas sp. MJ145 TaxID=3129234 RepID=UPI0031B9C6E1